MSLPPILTTTILDQHQADATPAGARAAGELVDLQLYPPCHPVASWDVQYDEGVLELYCAVCHLCRLRLSVGATRPVLRDAPVLLMTSTSDPDAEPARAGH